MKASDASTWLYAKTAWVLRVALRYIVFFVVLWVIGTCVSCVGGIVETRKLEGLEREIRSCMDAQEYESALIKTRELKPSSSASAEQREYWSQKREGYDSEIIRLKRERDSSDPSYIPAPASSEDFAGKSYEYVARCFEEAGFTNVELVEEFYKRRERVIPTGRPGRTRTEVEPMPVFLPWTRGSVSEVEFGCLTDFTTEDHCQAGERIVIHYHGDGTEPITVNVVEAPRSVPVTKPED